MKIPDREVGAMLCKCPSGYELSSPLSVGTERKVTVQGRCPDRCRAVGTVHTHPGGPVRLSSLDIKSLAKNNLDVGCVTDGKTMRCYRVKKK